MENLLLQISAYIFILLSIPTIVIIKYLFSHYKDVNGDIGKLRKILIAVLSASLLLMIVEIFIIFAIVYDIRLFNRDRLIFLNLATIVLAVTNWWALFKVKRLMNH